MSDTNNSLAGRKRGRESNASNIQNDRNTKRSRLSNPRPNAAGFNGNTEPSEIPPGAPVKASYIQSPPTSKTLVRSNAIKHLPNPAGFVNRTSIPVEIAPNAPRKVSIFDSGLYDPYSNNIQTARRVTRTFYPLAPVINTNNTLENIPNSYTMKHAPSQILKTFRTRVLPNLELQDKSKNEIRSAYRNYVAARTQRRGKMSYGTALQNASRKSQSATPNTPILIAKLQAKLNSATTNVNDETTLHRFPIPSGFRNVPVAERDQYFKRIALTLEHEHGKLYTPELIGNVYGLLRVYKPYLSPAFYNKLISNLAKLLPVSAGTRKRKDNRKN